MLIIGILVALLGFFIWGYAFFRSRIDDGILHNHLVTDGIYAWMRNPLYTGWMFVIMGVALCFGNLYGAEYDAYCKRVNRTWPWFPKG